MNHPTPSANTRQSRRHPARRLHHANIISLIFLTLLVSVSCKPTDNDEPSPSNISSASWSIRPSKGDRLEYELIDKSGAVVADKKQQYHCVAATQTGGKNYGLYSDYLDGEFRGLRRFVFSTDEFIMDTIKREFAKNEEFAISEFNKDPTNENLLNEKASIILRLTGPTKYTNIRSNAGDTIVTRTNGHLSTPAGKFDTVHFLFEAPKGSMTMHIASGVGLIEASSSEGAWRLSRYNIRTSN